MMIPDGDLVLIFDFGSQFAQLIAKKKWTG